MAFQCGKKLCVALPDFRNCHMSYCFRPLALQGEALKGGLLEDTSAGRLTKDSGGHLKQHPGSLKPPSDYPPACDNAIPVY